jgi:RES domain-containing protein
MPDLRAFFQTAAVIEFSGTVYRICPARYTANLASMRGAFAHGARYNIRGVFGALYTSLSLETARQEIARYFTVPPMNGFIEASINLRLTRVADLTNRRLLRRAGIHHEDLIAPTFTVSQEVALRAWEAGIEGMLAPSAANFSESNLVVFLDNQHPPWTVKLVRTDRTQT